MSLKSSFVLLPVVVLTRRSDFLGLELLITRADHCIATCPCRGHECYWSIVQSGLPWDVSLSILWECLLFISKSSENNDPAAIAQFSWIPQEILHMVGATAEVKLALISARCIDSKLTSNCCCRAIAEQVLAEFILPLPASPAPASKNTDIDEGPWTDRLLLTMKFLDETAVNTLLSFSGLKTT